MADAPAKPKSSQGRCSGRASRRADQKQATAAKMDAPKRAVFVRKLWVTGVVQNRKAATTMPAYKMSTPAANTLASSPGEGRAPVAPVRAIFGGFLFFFGEVFLN